MTILEWNTYMAVAIVVHGGVKTISADKAHANTEGCLAAVKAGWEILQQGGNAKDAVEAAIRVLESDPTFNSSVGGSMNADGQVFLDAAMMESDHLRWGAVAVVNRIAHPISVARKILEEKSYFLVGAGAERFAAEQGCEMCEPNSLIIEEQRQTWQQQKVPQDRPETVGCVALDRSGNLVAGTSTGGLEFQPAGRVGDTALVGCGLYADQRGACSTTGDGESVIPVVLAKTAVDLLSGNAAYMDGQVNCHPETAAERAIEQLKQRVPGEAGCILLDRYGRLGWAYNSQDMAVAYMTEALPQPLVFTHKEQPLAHAET